CHAHLLFEPAVAAKGNVLNATRFETAPGEPHVEIEIARCVGETFDDFGVDGNRMALDLAPERVAQLDDVLEFFGGQGILGLTPVEPQLHAIEVMEARPVKDEVFADLIFGAEEDGGGKDTLEAVDQPAVVGSGLLEAESLQHLACGTEAYRLAVLAKS